MELQKMLDESGYTRAVEELEGIKRQRSVMAEAVDAAPPELVNEQQALLDEMDEAIARAETALESEHEAAIKHLDATNDVELMSEDILERAELVAEHFANEMDRPDVAEWIRKLMAGENPGPPPKP